MNLRWKLFLGFLALLVLPMLLILATHWKVKSDVESYKKRLIASGEKLTIAEWIPQPATNGNAARAFLESVRPLSGINRDHHPLAMRMIAEGRAQVSWKSDEIYDSSSKSRTNIWAMIASDFEGNAEALEGLRGASGNGELIFPVAYERGFNALLPHLVRVKEGAVWLSAAAIYELHEGNKVEAKENLKGVLRLVKNDKGEPLLISHLVRIACVQIAFGATWEALQFPDWTDSELKEFQGAWESIEFQNLEAFLSMERAMGIRIFVEARASEQIRSQMFAAGGAAGSTTFLDDVGEFASEIMDNPKAAFRALFNRPNQTLWPWIQSYREELTLMKTWQIGLEASRAIEEEKAYQPALKTLQAKLDSTRAAEGEAWLGDSGSMVSRTLSKFASAKIARQLAITACSLQRYKLANGHYPGELKQMVPKFLTALPVDPMDGQPVRYQLKSDGTFMLYSTGENGIDDGGDPSQERIGANQKWNRARHPLYGRDWVWPLVASEEQITEWERHESGNAR